MRPSDPQVRVVTYFPLTCVAGFDPSRWASQLEGWCLRGSNGENLTNVLLLITNDRIWLWI